MNRRALTPISTCSCTHCDVIYTAERSSSSSRRAAEFAARVSRVYQATAPITRREILNGVVAPAVPQAAAYAQRFEYTFDDEADS
jgi:hypothetical protein